MRYKMQHLNVKYNKGRLTIGSPLSLFIRIHRYSNEEMVITRRKDIPVRKEKETIERSSNGNCFFTSVIILILVFVYGFISWTGYVSLSNWNTIVPDFSFAGLKIIFIYLMISVFKQIYEIPYSLQFYLLAL